MTEGEPVAPLPSGKIIRPMPRPRATAPAAAAALALLLAAAALPAQPQQAQPQPTQPEPIQPPPLGSTTAPDIRIGPGDLLTIEIFGFDELSRKVRIMRDGTATLPLLGAIDLSDLTLRGAERKIEDILVERQLVTDPQVTIYMEEVVSRAITIQGGVAAPGIYPLHGRRTLLEMIGQAGGLSTGQSDPGDIVVLRATEEGVRQRIDIDTTKLVTLSDLTLNIELEPGDIVMVPQARRGHVYLSGEVASPGEVPFVLSEGITLFQAITAAGGPTERAKLGAVFINRRNPDGTIERIKVDLKKIRKGKIPDVPLQPDDIVVVKQSTF